VSLQGDSRLIQDLEVGDDIMSWDPVTKSMFIDKVTHVIHHPAEPRVLLEILLENGTRIEPTPNHPIWLEEAQAYVPAQEIADRMLTLDCTTSKNQACPHLQAATGELLRVVDVRAMSENVDVYDISVAGSKTSDFSVQDQHNFFVNGLLVHNKFTNISCGLRPGTN
jgi:intein/homing endonuclease